MSSEQSTACLQAEDLKALATGQLEGGPLAIVEEHLSQCDSCCERLDQLSGDFLTRILPDERTAQESDDTPSPEPLLQAMEQLHATIILTEPNKNLVRPNLLELLGSELGPYELREEVGRGGMGVVLRGFGRDLERTVAVKVLAPEIAAVPRFREAFLLEARAAARLQHENVMPIYMVDQRGELPYFVMPFVEGPNLQQYLDEHGALEESEMVRIGCQLARALEAAHAEGLVHGDVKPGNVMLLEGEREGIGRVWLTDFGLVRALDDPESGLGGKGVTAGTPGYMAPELAAGEPGDHRSDLYALGCVLHCMAIGSAPGDGASMSGAGWLGELLETLLARDPSKRPGSASAVREQLEAQLPENRGLSRRTMMVAAGSLAAAVAVGAFVFRGRPNEPTASESEEQGYFSTEDGPLYASLAEAVEEAEPGATITVRVNGEVELEPLLIPADKPLTIRAAEGSEPIFVSRNWRDFMIQTESPLCLMGLEFRHPFASIPAEAAPILYSRAPTLHLANCRFVRSTVDRQSQTQSYSARPLVLLDDPEQVDIRNCELQTMAGTCVAVRGVQSEAAPASDLYLENNLLVGQQCLRLTSADSTPHTVKLVRNTLVAPIPLCLRSHGDGFLQSDLVLEGNLLEILNSLLELRILNPSAERAAAMRSTKWQASRNYYHLGGKSERGLKTVLACITGPRGRRLHEIVGEEKFAEAFGPLGTRVQDPIFDWDKIENYRAEFSLLKAELFEPEKPLEGAGFVRSLLGTGKPFTRWMATKGYQEWQGQVALAMRPKEKP